MDVRTLGCAAAVALAIGACGRVGFVADPNRLDAAASLDDAMGTDGGAMPPVDANLMDAAAGLDAGPGRDAGGGRDGGSIDAHVPGMSDAGPGRTDAGPTTGWTIEVVDRGGPVGTGAFASMALDRSGQPVIGYFEAATGPKVARFDGTSWNIRVVEPNPNVGEHLSLVIDAADVVHLAYYDRGAQDLRYARDMGTSWHVETVDSAGDVGMYTALTLDPSGRPHISYQGDAGPKVASFDGTSWRISSAGPRPMLASETSIAWAGTGPVVAYSNYRGGADGPLTIASWTGSAYATEEVPGASWVDHATVRVDRAGVLHVGYGNTTSGGWGYVWGSTGAWTTERTDTALIANADMVIDAAGEVHAAYNDSPSHAVRYAHRNLAGAWSSETFDPTGGGGWVTIAVDGAGRPLVAYYDSSMFVLKLARLR